MRLRAMWSLAGVAVLVVIAGCSASPGEAPVSAECSDAVSLAASTMSDSDLRETVRACKTVDEWVAAIREYPSVVGVKSAEYVDPEISMAGICYDDREAPACVDNAARGLDKHWK